MILTIPLVPIAEKGRADKNFSIIFAKKVCIFSESMIQYRGNNLWRCLTMAYKISDDCIACGACADACPVNAISEKDGKYVINADECLDCGACADACPVDAPKAE